MDSKQLKYFEEKLIKLKEDTLEEIEKIDINGISSENPADDNDLATIQYEQQFSIKLRERNIKYLKKIEKSILDIKNKVYGECKECGNEISFKRLDARPVASLCLECKEDLEKEEKSVKRI